MCPAVPIIKIISGGQTGVDRAALDWAMAHGIEHGGWCPRGRRAEDGMLTSRYRLQETPSDNYAQRTEWNVRDSDATLIISLNAKLKGGSLLTAKLASAYGRPCVHVHSALGWDQAVALVQDLVQNSHVRVLNVAGPRASGQPGVGQWASELLTSALLTNL